jgi:predicted nuclease of predicted toxin-antitoxin system
VLPGPIRFHLDEHIDPDIAHALRGVGVDVTTTVGVGLRTLDDPDHLDFIHREWRVIVTHDADFLRYSARGWDHPGIAYCPVGSLSIGQMIDALLFIYRVATPDYMRGRVEFLTNLV